MPFKNTGEQEVEQVDVNQNSPTFGEKRWISSGVNTTACPIPPPPSGTFRSRAIIETVYRDDCQNGQVPNGVNFRLEEGYSVSLISQADADQKARNYFDSQRQAYANQNDTCSQVQDPITCEIDGNGCWTGYVLTTTDGRREYRSTEEYNQCYVPSVSIGGTLYPCPAL